MSRAKTTAEKVATWLSRVPETATRIIGRDAGPDEPPLLDVPLGPHERESIVQELADALDGAQECADRAITVVLVALRETDAVARLVIRLKPPGGAIEVSATGNTAEANADIIRVLLTHNQAMTGQLVASVQSITKALSDTLSSTLSRLEQSEAKRMEANQCALDAIEAAQAAVNAKKNDGSAIERVIDMFADGKFGAVKPANEPKAAEGGAS